MRVAVIGDPAQLNSQYRVKQPAEALEHHGHAVLLGLIKEKEIRAERLAGYDAVYVYRFMSRPTQATLGKLRAAGSAILWDNDDDLTLNNASRLAESRARGAMRSQQVAGLLSSTFALADLVTTTSQQLATSFRRAGAREVHTVENFIATNYAAVRSARRGERIVIGWIAAQEHAHDLERLGLRDTLRRLIDAHPAVHVESVGVNLDLDRDRYTSHGYVRFEELAELVEGFDVGIAPLVDNDFNRARSNIKLKEYAAFGIPWLASPIGPYAGLGSREGGHLVPDERWFEELDALVTRPRERRKLAKRGERWARGETVQQNTSTWIQAFETAVRRRREWRATTATAAPHSP